MKLVIIFGPPGSGKTTYILKNKKPDDIIIDFDLLYRAVTGEDKYTKPTNQFKLVDKLRDYMIRACHENLEHDRAWITLTSKDLLDKYKKMYKCDVRIKTVNRSECYKNISNDPDRSENFELWKVIIDKWFKKNNVDAFEFV
jgi:hypothetical protein